MKLVIEIPPQFNSRVVPTVRLFYLQLFNYLIKQHIDYSIYPIVDSISNIIRPQETDYDYVLKYHTVESNQKVINIKISYLPDFFYFDKTGYSGWSEIANDKFPFEDLSLDSTVSEFSKLIQKYVKGNISKYKQKARMQNINFSRPFIFFPTQVENDAVTKLSYIPVYDLIRFCSEIIPRLGYDLVIKRHPCCNSERIGNLLKSVQNDHIHIVEYSIHDIIEQSLAVVVINSGVGIESLLHLKPVISFGHSDYHWVTYMMKQPDDLYKIPDIISKFGEEKKGNIMKFIVYFFKNYLIELDNISSYNNAFRRLSMIM
jgi:hypothetical protein